MKKRMLYIFLLAVVATIISILIPRKGDCGFLPYNCPEYFIRGYPIQVWSGQTNFAFSFRLIGFFANSIIYFALIYVLYFCYEFVAKISSKKK